MSILPNKERATLLVLSGRFASQPLAFAALLQEAQRHRVKVDLADVDVIREAGNVRLAHYFRPAIVARIQELQGEDDTLIVIRPSPLQAQGLFRDQKGALRRLGLFAGEVIEARSRDDLE